MVQTSKRIISGPSQVVDTNRPTDMFTQNIGKQTDQFIQNRRENKADRIRRLQDIENTQIQGNIRDQAVGNRMKDELVQWMADQRMNGVNTNSEAFQVEYNKRLAQIKRVSDYAGAWQNEYQNNLQRMKATPYFNFDEGAKRFDEMYDKPIYDPETGEFRDPSEIDSIYKDPSLYNDQYFVDTLNSKERIKTSPFSKEEGHYTNQYDASMDPNYWQQDQTTGEFSVVEHEKFKDAFWNDYENMPEPFQRKIQNIAKKIEFAEQASAAALGASPAVSQRPKEDYLAMAYRQVVEQYQKPEMKLRTQRQTKPAAYTRPKPQAEIVREQQYKELENMYSDIASGNKNVLQQYKPMLAKQWGIYNAEVKEKDGKVWIEYDLEEPYKGPEAWREGEKVLVRQKGEKKDINNKEAVINLLDGILQGKGVIYQAEGAAPKGSTNSGDANNEEIDLSEFDEYLTQ